ncbi:hypothetical protein MKW94_028228 [Papaver nudicaule]|uniref:F-box domain-containing protein n=1 Tax=Papaver nudicaule TaxID=74823 RepID=A0AA41S3H6_PAPNU|nr:hypothetical protein [Papaver nudicaule]
MNHFDVLPVDISVHIFSLLPIESVSDFALVSKSWKSLIHSRSFLVMHANRLLHLAKQVNAELHQKREETEEYSKSMEELAPRVCTSMELLEEFLKIHSQNCDEKMNSIRLAGRNKQIYNQYSHNSTQFDDPLLLSGEKRLN